MFVLLLKLVTIANLQHLLDYMQNNNATSHSVSLVEHLNLLLILSDERWF